MWQYIDKVIIKKQNVEYHLKRQLMNFDIYVMQGLMNKTHEELILEFGSIPKDRSCLDLSNNFHGISNEEVELVLDNLIIALPFIPNHIGSMNLSFNGFGTTPFYLIQILKALPYQIKHIDLSNNILGLCERHIYDIFAAITDSCISLLIHNNDFDDLSSTSFITALNGLSNTASVRQIYLGEHDRATQRSNEDQNTLRRATSEKSFFLIGNGSDAALAHECLNQVIAVKEINGLIAKYLHSSKEVYNLNFFSSQDNNDPLMGNSYSFHCIL
jgi:hypothetical protein